MRFIRSKHCILANLQQQGTITVWSCWLFVKKSFVASQSGSYEVMVTKRSENPSAQTYDCAGKRSKQSNAGQVVVGITIVRTHRRADRYTLSNNAIRTESNMTTTGIAAYTTDSSAIRLCDPHVIL